MNTTILRDVAVAMANFGVPMLLDEKHWPLAEQMADQGLLQRHARIFKSHSFTLTDAGMAAYLEAYPPAPAAAPAKAWGERAPKTLRARVAFIRRQCRRDLEDAYWLEIEDEKGRPTESWTLSSSALDKKLSDLGYDAYDRPDHIHFGREDCHEAMPTCEVTGDLLNGSWSGDPYDISYGVDGFAWRRAEGFQMEERDWLEARGFIERLDAADREQAKLRRLIVNSCFREPSGINTTGLICPGGGCQSTYGELIELFGFMTEQQPKESASSAERTSA